MTAAERPELAESIRIACWLVLRWARGKRLPNASLDLDDLLQEARLGVLLAAEKFDPARGVKPATYLAKCGFRRAIRALAHSTPVPETVVWCDLQAAYDAEPWSLDWVTESGDRLGDFLGADPTDGILDGLERAAMWERVRTLPARQQAAVTLSYGAEHGGRQLAARLGVSSTMAYQDRAKGVRRLRAELGG